MTNHGTGSPNVNLLQFNGKFYNNTIPILYQHQLMEIYTPLGPTILSRHFHIVPTVRTSSLGFDGIGGAELVGASFQIPFGRSMK